MVKVKEQDPKTPEVYLETPFLVCQETEMYLEIQESDSQVVEEHASLVSNVPSTQEVTDVLSVTQHCSNSSQMRLNEV